MAIRLGQLADSSHRAALIDSFAIFPVAAPGYLADRPIHSLTDLAQAQWIAHSRLSSPLSWLVATPQREAVLFKVADAATLTGDSAAALLAFALHGTGVALLPAWLAQPKSTPAGCSGCCRITVSPSRASMRSTRTPAMCRKRCGRLSIFCARG